ncbi:MAG: CPBP family intramembrane glutamic endopeptidase [Cyanobacteria bacterium P01_C01_bin.118]
MGRNPFDIIKFRTHVLSTFIAIYLVLLTVFVVLEYQNLLPWSIEDRLWQPINSMVIFGTVCAILLVTGQRAGLRIKQLFGRVPRFPLGYGLLLITSMFIFSLSSSLLLFYPISFLAPGFVEERLSQQLFEIETAVPAIYKGLMLFVAIVFAPLTEEFIFRGVLLQRWAVRWNLPIGIMASSVLFGILHVNNPLGLTMFGVIMALLYIRTRSLWVPIIAHALNNIVAVTPELLFPSSDTFKLEDLQQGWWMGLVGLCIAAPTLIHFISKNWPQKSANPPYFRE